ncbi:SIS domain-containing protein [Breznakiella homolactica]|uniref:Glutamine--fructose-6-phosphate aminotransferase [isomerizing] n=1 Tax=Breznakiella homolactica TaxID=2798577 RepID=A0A7T7XRI5_9SPIR|nr:SIS domain-containing protein [Breznakiella homolactica]QQO11160.1 SIS domain-containing protein [Breznakiella homolactica]
MDRREPELILDQMKTYGNLHRKELPGLLLNPGLSKDAVDLKPVHVVYAIGDGDSYYAAQSAEYGFKHISGTIYFPVPALEFLHYILPVLGERNPETLLVIGISASGGSPIVVEAIQECRSRYPKIKTLAICGKKESLLESSAEYSEAVQLEELGRTPGIRTYAASLTGLFSAACSIGEAKGRSGSLSRKSIAAFIAENAEGAEKTIENTIRMGPALADIAGGSFIGCVGSGPDQGTALFSSAKIVEGSGVTAAGQDLEEWNHVESFAYPLDSALIIFANPGPAFKRAATLISAAKALGHRIIAVVPGEIHDFDASADAVVPVFGIFNELLAPLTQYIPGTVLAYYLAKKHGRAMFMSDR